jgi:antitoxin ParD1/3/4
MTVTLSPRLEAMIEDRVLSGDYTDAEAVIEEALRLLEERDRLGYLHAAAAKGLEQIDRGEEIIYTPEVGDKLWESAMQKFRGDIGFRPLSARSLVGRVRRSFPDVESVVPVSTCSYIGLTQTRSGSSASSTSGRTSSAKSRVTRDETGSGRHTLRASIAAT